MNEAERASLYYICGYVTFKESISVDEIIYSAASEFTDMVSRGNLKHPPPALYDLSLYLYSFFKKRKNKCCTKIFLQAYHYIYECTGFEFINIDKILSRLNNCFFKGYASNETDKIKAKKNEEMCRKKRKLNS